MRAYVRNRARRGLVVCLLNAANCAFVNRSRERLSTLVRRRKLNLQLTTNSANFCMVWYGMVNVDLYSAIITKVSNALSALLS